MTVVVLMGDVVDVELSVVGEVSSVVVVVVEVVSQPGSVKTWCPRRPGRCGRVRGLRRPCPW
jgi:hypothetical protein